MPTLTDGVLFGLSILFLDFLAWRFVDRKSVEARLFCRALLFGLSTYVLFRAGMNPFRGAPWDQEPLRHVLAQGLEVVWWLQGARLVTVLLDRVVLPETWHKERLFQDVLGALVFLTAVVGAIAFVLQLPVRGLLATSGALAVVLGLAIQSTLNDVFSGVVLNATQPFHLGDWITIGDVQGKVVESNWRATSLLNGQGNIVVIPNSVAARTNIVNANQPSHTHGISIVIPIEPSVRPALVLGAMRNAAASSQDILGEPAPIVSVYRATNDAIEYQIVCYVDELSKTIDARNALFDLAYRHLLSFGIALHRLSVPRLASEPVRADDGMPVGMPAGARRRDEVDDRQRLLRNIAIFNTLFDDEIEALSGQLIKRDFETGATIYAAADERLHALYIVFQGVASVSVAKGAEMLELRRLVPGDAIGQSGILAGVKTGVVVCALTRCVVFQLDKTALTPILTQRPEVAQEMCRLLSEHHATEQMLLAVPAHVDETAGGVLQWIREGVRRLHGHTP